VHELPCDQDQGGEHYKHDPAIEAEIEDNEIWLRFTTDGNGRGVASSQQLGQVARRDAQSIVVHDPAAGNARMACANLFFDDPADAEIALQGGFTAYPDAPAEDQDIGGSVSITVSVEDDETFINLDLEGLDEAASYRAYVHELPCEVNEAGGHYKRDTTVEDEDEDNEIWPDLDQQEQTFSHALRYDAQSMVLYRVADSEQRVACANLVRMTGIPEYVTEGEGGALPDVEAPFDDIEATARLERKRDGTTVATLEVTGLPADAAEFDAYVHAGTCNLDPPGGPRYKLDPEVTAEIESNEISLGFAVDGEGGASSSNDKDAHLARPDAVSVIIHAPGTDTRLSCIELQ
jgi:hypothetical protein